MVQTRSASIRCGTLALLAGGLFVLGSACSKPAGTSTSSEGPRRRCPPARPGAGVRGGDTHGSDERRLRGRGGRGQGARGQPRRDGLGGGLGGAPGAALPEASNPDKVAAFDWGKSSGSTRPSGCSSAGRAGRPSRCGCSPIRSSPSSAPSARRWPPSSAAKALRQLADCLSGGARRPPHHARQARARDQGGYPGPSGGVPRVGGDGAGLRQALQRRRGHARRDVLGRDRRQCSGACDGACEMRPATTCDGTCLGQCERASPAPAPGPARASAMARPWPRRASARASARAGVTRSARASARANASAGVSSRRRPATGCARAMLRPARGSALHGHGQARRHRACVRRLL